MSPISVIGRLAAGQVREMVADPNRAIQGKFGLISQMDFFVHYIEASNKLYNSIVRNDAMTNQNGFDCNKMSTVSLKLTKQNSTTHPSKKISFYIELLAGKGIKLNFDFVK